MNTKNAVLDFSAAGLMAAWLGLMQQFPQLQQVPLWAVLVGACVAAIGRGLWLAYANDGKITREEAAAIFGVAVHEVEGALALAKEKGLAPGSVDGEIGPDDKTPIVSMPRLVDPGD